MKFKIRVWFRYAANGEQEKECEDFEVESLGIHDAFKKIQSRYFTSLSSIPFQYGQVINGTVYMWYKPFGSYMSEDYNKPLSELNKTY
jgi:hypothetical protein